MVDGDILKADKILDKNILEVLNWLSLMKEKSVYETE